MSSYQGKDLKKMGLKICSRCIYDETVPGISFDEKGECNYCKMIAQFKEEFGTGKDKGNLLLDDIIQRIKKAGRGKKYDVIVGVSGGTDSSYMIHMCVKVWGLRPLAVHYDNTWNTSIATENIRKVLGKLNVDLYTLVVDNKESDDLFKSFFEASVCELDAPTDLAYAETMYRAAWKYKVKYTFEGHSFMEEGISPLGSAYMDGMYIKGIHDKFGQIKMKTYPLMTFYSFIFWAVFARIKKIRPLWYIDYSKAEAKRMLAREYGWEDYGGHHLENRLTAFNHSYYFPQKFGVDQRNNTLSALVRGNMVDKDEALKIYASPPHMETELLEYFKKRMGINDEEFDSIMSREKKTFRDYKTYKKRFERFRPLFFLLYKANLVYKSFYVKFCFPIKDNK
jgi:N-acetyl sugar amidotransferase